MNELDEFRPRLRNWARVYRDRFIRQESNLMPLIRSIMALNPDAVASEPRFPPNVRDAEFIDLSINELRKRNSYFSIIYGTLKAEYLTAYSSETYENEDDRERAKKSRAKYARVFPWAYDETLEQAERMVMEYIKHKEGVYENLS